MGFIIGFIVVFGITMYLFVTQNRAEYAGAWAPAPVTQIQKESESRIYSYLGDSLTQTTKKLLEAWENSEGFLREILAAELFTSVYSWESWCRVEKFHGHNGVVYFDSVLNRRASTFIPKNLVGADKWKIERFLCSVNGYTATTEIRFNKNPKMKMKKDNNHTPVGDNHAIINDITGEEESNADAAGAHVEAGRISAASAAMRVALDRSFSVW